MSESDFIIIGVLLLLTIAGYVRGLIVSVLSLAGMVLGVFAGSRLAEIVFQQDSQAPYSPLIGLGIGVGVLLLTLIVVRDVALRLRGRLKIAEHKAIDSVLGALFGVVAAIFLVWISAAVIVTTPQFRDARPWVFASNILPTINAALPSPKMVLNRIARYDPFPVFDGPNVVVDAPDPQVPRNPNIRAVAPSVVRVVGEACGLEVTGSGWIIERGIVVTNAHVIAGEQRTHVQVRGQGKLLDARVIAFDANEDIAVLRVSSLSKPAIELARNAPRGTSSAILGYPENGGFTVRAARVSREQRVQSRDLYGAGPIERTILIFRGDVRHGNSGGPLVNEQGEVLGTIFASTVGSATKGGYAVPNDVVRDIVNVAKQGGEVDTGPCVS